MQSIVTVFWAGVFAALLMALWDCTRWPRQTATAWRQFRPVAFAVLAVAGAFFVVNLVRWGIGDLRLLGVRALELATITVVATAFYCGGWAYVTRRGHVGLFDRIRRWRAGLEGPRVRPAAVETALVSAIVVVFSLGYLWMFTHLFGEPQKSASFEQWLSSPGSQERRTGLLALRILLAPLWEETAFRWYMQNRVEDALAPRSWRRPLAIAVTAAVWACGHAALTDPPWFKLVHIFAVGCLLGWRFRTIGLSGCVLGHLAMNIPAVLALC
jgi:membrane protease YdiL (CAAX protease family)